MISWYYIAVVACILALFLIYKEWAKKKRSHLYGRLIASMLAVISLLFMAYPYAASDSTAKTKLVVLTGGFIKDSVDNFLKRNKGDIAVFSDTRAGKYSGNVQLVTDWNGFAVKHNSDTFHVFGNGFSDETLALLNAHPIVFHVPPASPGISNIYWKQNLEPGEQLVVQGAYENNSQKKISIVLQAFETDKDTVSIAAGTHRDFELHTVPEHTGRAVYSLISIAGNDTLQKEPVPADVQTTAPIQLLIISSSPDFDNTFLKNHLSQQGYQVTVTTTISSNKTDKQFLNMPAREVAGRLTVSYLDKFDVLIADEEALQKISPAERAAIRSSVQEKGTGLLVKMDGQNRQAFYSRFFPVKTLQQDKQSFLLLHGVAADSNRYKIKITDPVHIDYQTGTQILLQDAQSNIYASGILYGNGKIIATTLQNTYSMALAGDRTSYQQLWWLLLNKTAKKIYPKETWRTKPFISFINNPVQVEVEKNEVAIPRAGIDHSNIYLKQDALLPFVWKGIYWPAKNGWQELPQVNAGSGGWYVYKPGDWQQLINHQYAAATKKYAIMHPVAFTEETPVAGKVPVNMRLYLLIVFLASCIFLWVEQKTG
ncbi:MAG TPA: hypothetical protein VK645_06205 [Chitinophagaceae bacterium]|nr:hypothetical protein [Chitinophagaceae bacterium]